MHPRDPRDPLSGELPTIPPRPCVAGDEDGGGLRFPFVFFAPHGASPWGWVQTRDLRAGKRARSNTQHGRFDVQGSIAIIVAPEPEFWLYSLPE